MAHHLPSVVTDALLDETLLCHGDGRVKVGGVVGVPEPEPAPHQAQGPVHVEHRRPAPLRLYEPPAQ